MSARTLLVAPLTLALALLLGDRALGWYAPRHFIPEARMQQAIAQGPGCIVFAGDSRMVAGFDEQALKGELRRQGRNDCVATIAIGALRAQGFAVALREYIERGGRPQVLVLGAAEETLVRPSAPLDPADFVGNEAIQLAWSEPSDVWRLYPAFPYESVGIFDRGFRFSLARSTAFGSYLSLGWSRIHAVQDRLMGRARAQNVFGALEDMEASGRQMVKNAGGLLGAVMREPPEARLHPAFHDIEGLLSGVGARLVVVELPMPADYRRSVTDSPEGQRYLAWFRAYLAERQTRLVDLTHAEWLEPGLFADFVHLNAAGATAFSRDVGRAVASPEAP